MFELGFYRLSQYMAQSYESIQAQRQYQTILGQTHMTSIAAAIVKAFDELSDKIELAENLAKRKAVRHEVTDFGETMQYFFSDGSSLRFSEVKKSTRFMTMEQF